MKDVEYEKGLVAELNSWEIQSIAPSKNVDRGWTVVAGETTRVVEDLLEGFDGGDAEGVQFNFEMRDDTAEIDETVTLRRSPRTVDGDLEPGVVMWGQLTYPAEGKGRGTFFGTIAFFDEQEEGDALMTVAAIHVDRLRMRVAVSDLTTAVRAMNGTGGAIVQHAAEILEQIGVLSETLKAGILASRDAA